MNTPPPESLADFLEAARKVLVDETDAASFHVGMILGVQYPYQVTFTAWDETPCRSCCGVGNTPEEAIVDFRSQYRPRSSVADRIAELQAELAKLKGGDS